MVDNSGAIIVNLGARDGIEVGMQLLVVRGVWNAGIEKVVLQKIGVIEVSRLEVNDCVCRSVSGSLPRRFRTRGRAPRSRQPPSSRDSRPCP